MTLWRVLHAEALKMKRTIALKMVMIAPIAVALLIVFGIYLSMVLIGKRHWLRHDAVPAPMSQKVQALVGPFEAERLSHIRGLSSDRDVVEACWRIAFGVPISPDDGTLLMPQCLFRGDRTSQAPAPRLSLPRQWLRCPSQHR